MIISKFDSDRAGVWSWTRPRPITEANDRNVLLCKASGRVFGTDTDFDQMAMAQNGSPKQGRDFYALARRAHVLRLHNQGLIGHV
jgi:hypothetical protein